MIIFPFQTKILKKDLKVNRLIIFPYGKLKTYKFTITIMKKLKIYKNSIVGNKNWKGGGGGV